MPKALNKQGRQLSMQQRAVTQSLQYPASYSQVNDQKFDQTIVKKFPNSKLSKEIFRSRVVSNQQKVRSTKGLKASQRAKFRSLNNANSKF